MKSQYKVYKEASIFYLNASFFWYFFFFKNISASKSEPINGKKCCLPPFSFQIGLKLTSLHPYLNSLGFYLSTECLLNILWLVHFAMCGKLFWIHRVHISRKCIESMHFYSCSSLPPKTQGRIFWKSVSPKTKSVDGGNYDFLYQNSIRKCEYDLEQ